MDADPDHWGVSQALGIYSSETGQASVRAEFSGGAEMAGEGLSGHFLPGETRKD
jgi:hypothetical protein